MQMLNNPTNYDGAQRELAWWEEGADRAINELTDLDHPEKEDNPGGDKDSEGWLACVMDAMVNQHGSDNVLRALVAGIRSVTKDFANDEHLADQVHADNKLADELERLIH
jgi:hypothetical protein